ncbi:helix-turn-helix domain-containing protein, partial [Yersinia pekkanenii]|uniref:helix-turn-helix domain-containing protein n=1 Tax=Yersinia pekkanenii TaxID=1288385 RepID=UPI00092D3631
MQGTHLTQKERFYIEKRRDDRVNQATIARELQLPRSTISRELRRNTDALSTAFIPAEGLKHWPEDGVRKHVRIMWLTSLNRTFKNLLGRRCLPTLHLRSSVAACSWNWV